MRYLMALAAIAMVMPAAHAREQQDMHERVRDAVNRTDKNLQQLVHPEKLDQAQRAQFDTAVKDLRDFREAIAANKWDSGHERLEKTIDDVDAVVKHVPMADGDRQTLQIDLFTLKTIRDSWKQ